MKRKLTKLKNSLEKETEKIRRIIETMPYRGDTNDNSQKVLLLSTLNFFESCINGIEAKDLEELKDGE